MSFFQIPMPIPMSDFFLDPLNLNLPKSGHGFLKMWCLEVSKQVAEKQFWSFIPNFLGEKNLKKMWLIFNNWYLSNGQTPTNCRNSSKELGSQDDFFGAQSARLRHSCSDALVTCPYASSCWAGRQGPRDTWRAWCVFFQAPKSLVQRQAEQQKKFVWQIFIFFGICLELISLLKFFLSLSGILYPRFAPNMTRFDDLHGYLGVTAAIHHVQGARYPEEPTAGKNDKDGIHWEKKTT